MSAADLASGGASESPIPAWSIQQLLHACSKTEAQVMLQLASGEQLSIRELADRIERSRVGVKAAIKRLIKVRRLLVRTKDGDGRGKAVYSLCITLGTGVQKYPPPGSASIPQRGAEVSPSGVEKYPPQQPPNIGPQPSPIGELEAARRRHQNAPEPLPPMDVDVCNGTMALLRGPGGVDAALESVGTYRQARAKLIREHGKQLIAAAFHELESEIRRGKVIRNPGAWIRGWLRNTRDSIRQ